MIALALLAAAILGVVRADEENLNVMFVNEFPDKAIDLYWERSGLPADHPEKRVLEANIAPRGGYHTTNSYLGHEFSYVVDGQRHYITPPEGNVDKEQFVILAGDEGKDEGFRVQCQVSTFSQKSTDTFDIVVKPYWAPRAASRFLDLVRLKYYDGVAFNRVEKNFITRFGIAKDFAVRSAQKGRVFADDFPTVGFEPGYISFAGNPGEHDRRSTELFIVSPNISPTQLTKFGKQSFEVPFGVVEDKNGVLSKIYSGYGNTGPDTAVMYESGGYDYLKKNFPKLDYIERCYVVDELGLGEEL